MALFLSDCDLVIEWPTFLAWPKSWSSYELSQRQSPCGWCAKNSRDNVRSFSNVPRLPDWWHRHRLVSTWLLVLSFALSTNSMQIWTSVPPICGPPQVCGNLPTCETRAWSCRVPGCGGHPFQTGFWRSWRCRLTVKFFDWNISFSENTKGGLQHRILLRLKSEPTEICCFSEFIMFTDRWMRSMFTAMFTTRKHCCDTVSSCQYFITAKCVTNTVRREYGSAAMFSNRASICQTRWLTFQTKLHRIYGLPRSERKRPIWAKPQARRAVSKPRFSPCWVPLNVANFSKGISTRRCSFLLKQHVKPGKKQRNIFFAQSHSRRTSEEVLKYSLQIFLEAFPFDWHRAFNNHHTIPVSVSHSFGSNFTSQFTSFRLPMDGNVHCAYQTAISNLRNSDSWPQHWAALEISSHNPTGVTYCSFITLTPAPMAFCCNMITCSLCSPIIHTGDSD